MDIFSMAEKTMRMGPDAWARHANPLSVWTRALGTPFVFIAVWSYHWIGWGAAALIAAVVFWTFVNPRLFSPPKHTETWAAQAVLGERVFLNRKQVSIPSEHARAAWITTSFAVPFLGLSLYGFMIADFWTAFGGWHGAVLAKLWFCDRMVWLWQDMKEAHPTYRAWAQADWTATLND